MAWVAADAGGGLDTLISDADITKDCMFYKMTYEQWRVAIDTDLVCCFSGSYPVIRPMRECGFPRRRREISFG